MEVATGRALYRRLLAAARSLPEPAQRRLVEKVLRKRFRNHAATDQPAQAHYHREIGACTERFLVAAGERPLVERLIVKSVVQQKEVRGLAG